MPEDDARIRMLAAIGDVAMNSGHASMALQQMLACVAGTDLTYFMLRDETLGFQVKQATKVVEATTTNEWIAHPSIDPEMRELILATLKVMNGLVSHRNRVVHDLWDPESSDEFTDGVRGYKGDAVGRGGRAQHPVNAASAGKHVLPYRVRPAVSR